MHSTHVFSEIAQSPSSWGYGQLAILIGSCCFLTRRLHQ